MRHTTERPTTDFSDALQVLNQAHCKEVESLKAEVEALKAQLGHTDVKVVADGRARAQEALHLEVSPLHSEARVARASSAPETESDIHPETIGARRPSLERRSASLDSVRLHSKTRFEPEIESPDLHAGRKPSVRVRACSISFPLREVWKGKLSVLEKQLTTARRFSLAAGLDKGMMPEELVVRGEPWFVQKMIIHPSSFKRFMWDLTSMTLLAYDVMAIPFVSAFPSRELDESAFLTNMTFITMTFWTLDVLASLATGYLEGKRIIMDPVAILRRYIRTWFVMDLVLLTMDWVYLFSLEDMTDVTGGSSARLGRSLRILRFIRTLRLFRLLKLKRIVQDLQDHINTETVAIIFGIVKIIVSLIVANHLVACGWNAVGLSAGEGEDSWVKAGKMDERDLQYQYTTALHWSLTQFTPASMEVYPHNTGERIYSVAVLIMAMVCFSSFVSILTASMMELRKLQNDGSRQFWLLRRYMRDWGVSKRTRIRIQRYCEYAYKRQKQRVQEKDVNLLMLLSDPLREEMKYETFAAHLFAHPLFLSCDDRTRIFSSAVSASSLAKDDQAFSCGMQASHMIFLTDGALEYILGAVEDDFRHELMTPMSKCSANSLDDFTSEHSSPLSPGSEMIFEGQWVAEAVLWTPWIHLGDLFALQESQIVVVDSQKFTDAVRLARPLLTAVSIYAEKFLDTLNRVDKEELTDLLHKVISSQDVIAESGFTIMRSRAQLDEGDTDAWGGFPKMLNNLRRKLGFLHTKSDCENPRSSGSGGCRRSR